MDLAQLRSLCAVVDRGSFAEAADALGLTQPALSMQLSRLEDELGLSLFLKTGRRKVLGAEGLVVLARARRILAEVRAWDDDVSALQGVSLGTLSVAASDTVQRSLLAPRFVDFAGAHPGVRLRAWNRTTLDVLALVRDAHADLGFVTLPVIADDLVVRPWRQFVWKAVAAVTGPGWTPEVSLSELASQPIVLLEPGTSIHTLWTQACLTQGLTTRRLLEVGSTDLQLDWAARGLGVAVVPDYAVADPTLGARTVPELGVGQLALVQRRGRLTRAAEAFLASFPEIPALG